MDFRILGPLEVVDGDVRVHVGTAKSRALLAFLLLHANEVVSVDRLIDALWDEEPPETARKALQVYVSQLRKVLGKDRLQTESPGYRLWVAEDELDLDRFQRLAAKQPREALAHWRGQPLAEFASHRFAQPEIARLEELYLACVERRVDGDIDRGLHVDVVGELERLVRLHPLRERLRAQLMVALYRSGRQAEALDAYRAARAAMVDELGIEPSKALQSLQQAILRQDSSLELAAPETPAGDHPPAGVFVGREVELDALRAGLDAASSGHGGVFLLVGEPGIGKSRLGEEVGREAHSRGAVVLVGRAWEAGGAPPYWPWVQSLRTLVSEIEDTRLRVLLAGRAELCGLLPELQQRFQDLPPPGDDESDGARFRLFEAVSSLLHLAAESRPLVLVLDDLHAADEPSLLLLRYVARELAGSRVLVLAAYRDVDPTPTEPLTIAVTELLREPATRMLQLSGLHRSDVDRFIELISGEAASDELVAAIHDETEGNPLFVGEIVRLLASEGRLHASDTSDVAIPQTVRDVISRRLRRLSPDCNRLLVLGSVLGREFGVDVVAHMGSLSEEELLDVLDEAIFERVIREVATSPPRLRFAHILIRDTLYDGVTLVRRVRFHRLAVAALEALQGEEPGPHLAELASHALAASEFEKGLEYARRAGDRALGLLAYEEATRLYEMALEAAHLSKREDETIRCELLLSLGEAESRAGDSESARAAFVEASELARRLGLSHLLARAAAGYGGRIVWARAGEDSRLVPMLEEALAALGDEDLDLRARLLARLSGGALRDDPSRARRDALSRDAIEIARRLGRPATLAYALAGRGAAIIAPDTVEERFAIGTELCSLASEVGETEAVVDGHYHRLIAYLELGNREQAVVELEAMSRIAAELRQPAQRWQEVATRAMIALGCGDLESARSLIPEALTIGERTQATAAVPAFTLQQFMLDDFEDRIERSEEPLADAVRLYPARPVFRCALAYVHARLEQDAEAQATLADFAAHGFSNLPFDFEWLYGATLLAETSAIVGDRASEARLYGMLRPYEQLCVVDVPEGMRGSVARYLGVLATRVRPEHAESHFENASELNERMGARPWLARTQEDYASMLLERNLPRDEERAQRLLDDAGAAYRASGMTGHVERVRGLGASSS